MNSNKSKLLIFRDIVRIFFIFSFFFLPEMSERFFGTEIEFENEYIVLLTILVFGTFWCGWFCPFGHAQYWAEIIGKKCFPNFQLSIPEKLDKGLRYLKYFFLIMFLYIFITGEFGYFEDHISMYKSTWYSHVYLMFKKPWAIMLIPLFIPRFFCKYLCYQKAGYRIINRVFPVLAIQRDSAACTSCNKCTTNCPMDIDIANAQKISGGECIGCFSCVDETGCPTDPSSLSLVWFGKKVRPMTLSIGVLIFYVFATAVMIFGFSSMH